MVHPVVRAVALAALFVAAAPLHAQDVRVLTRPDLERRILLADDRPMIGVSTIDESERADTLGLRIESVQRDSPAERAGLKAGDRLQSINGVSLRADRADAGEDDYAGVLNRRLQREVQRTKPGESVELRVLADGQARTVRVTPVKASELLGGGMLGVMTRGESGDRAVLGLTVTGTGSVRDTLGVFVQSVVEAGPAEKAGIVEGDRIAAINGVSLRVAREDAGDHGVGAARADRLRREVAKLKAGDVAELLVVTAGRTRTVRVTAVKASELPDGHAEAFLFASPREGLLRLPLEEHLMRLPLEEHLRRRSLEERLQRRLKETQPRVQRLQVRRVIRTTV